MRIENLHDLFVHTLQDIYFAEHTILEKLPLMAEAAHNPQLRTAFEKHIVETREHVSRLDQVFASIGEVADADECPAIEGITEVAEELMADIQDPETRDAAMLAAAQAIEHFEISRYGTLAAWAEEMHHREAAALLHRTLEDEKAADAILTKLAEGRLNRQAAA